MDPMLQAIISRVHGSPVKLKPFATDTLFKLAGGSVPVVRSHDFSPLGPDNEALTLAPLRPAQGDTGVVFYKDPSDHVLAHEVGHVMDHRGNNAALFGNVDAQRKPHLGRVNTQDDYFRHSRDEYVAEAFARAVESGRRHHFSDSTKVDKGMPGSIDIIRWLLQTEPFGKAAP